MNQKKRGRFSEGEFISAAEAVKRLGIKPETLYAYVSRGLVQSHSVEGKKARLYSREDLDRLRLRGRSGSVARAAHALRWGEPVLESAVTFISPTEIYYRGQAVGGLAAGFEGTAELLWTGILPERQPEWDLPDTAVLDPVEKHGPLSVSQYARFFSKLANSLSGSDRYCENTLDGSLCAARALIRLFAAAAGGSSFPAALRERTVARAWLRGFDRRASPEALGLIDLTLTYSADHELNPSTFAARVVASTGADLFASVMAAMAALSGPKHGGAVDEVARFLDSFSRPAEARTRVRALLSRGQPVPGFGHKLYRDGDPRAKAILASCRTRFRALGLLAEKADAVAAEMKRETGLEPNLDLALILVCDILKVPVGAAFSLFAVGRTAGWIAHILEQRQQGTLLRPRARYVGNRAISS